MDERKVRNLQLDDQVAAVLRDRAGAPLTSTQVWQALGFDEPRLIGGDRRWLCLPAAVAASLKRLERRGLARSVRYPGSRSLDWYGPDAGRAGAPERQARNGR